MCLCLCQCVSFWRKNSNLHSICFLHVILIHLKNKICCSKSISWFRSVKCQVITDIYQTWAAAICDFSPLRAKAKTSTNLTILLGTAKNRPLGLEVIWTHSDCLFRSLNLVAFLHIHDIDFPLTTSFVDPSSPRIIIFLMNWATDKIRTFCPKTKNPHLNDHSSIMPQLINKTWRHKMTILLTHFDLLSRVTQVLKPNVFFQELRVASRARWSQTLHGSVL